MLLIVIIFNIVAIAHAIVSIVTHHATIASWIIQHQ